MGMARHRRRRQGLSAGFLARTPAWYVLVVFLSFPWLIAASSAEPPLEVSREAAETAAGKFRQVLEGSLSGRSFGEIRITEIEINSYLHYELAPAFPSGLSSLRLKFQPNRPQGWLQVNFDQLKGNFETPPNPLMDYFLQGEHTMGVEGTFYTANGMGRFQLETVTVDGITVPRFVVDFLIEHYLRAHFPNADPNRPFHLPSSIQKIVVEEGRFLMAGKSEGN